MSDHRKGAGLRSPLKKRAMTSTSASLKNSDGWMLTTPSESQRWAPMPTMPDHVDGQQRREPEAVGDPREVQDDVVVDERRQQQRGQTDAETPEVIVEQRRDALRPVGGAVDADRAGRGERQRQPEHDPVEVAQQPPVDHGRALPGRPPPGGSARATDSWKYPRLLSSATSRRAIGALDRTAVAAVLDDDRDRDLGRPARRVADEPGVVLGFEPPRLALAFLGPSAPPAPYRSCPRPKPGNARAGARAARLVHHPPEPAPDRGERLRFQPHRALDDAPPRS